MTCFVYAIIFYFFMVRPMPGITVASCASPKRKSEGDMSTAPNSPEEDIQKVKTKAKSAGDVITLRKFE